MTDENGAPEEYEGPTIFKEPWRQESTGVWTTSGDGYAVKHRDSIKTKADSPHIAVIMPIGGKDEVEVHVCEHCNKRTKGEVYRGPGLVPAELMLNQMQLMMPLNVSVTFYMMKNNLSAVLRDVMTKMALKAGANFLFYWDDDTLVPGDAWYKMLNWMSRDPTIGMISGVYYTKMSPPEPLIYKQPSVGAYWGLSEDPNAPPEDIYACGAGCMMVRSDAVRQMSEPYWWDQRTGTEDGARTSVLGHDIRFCRKMHEETDYRVTADGSIQCMHFDIRGQKAYVKPDVMPDEDTKDVLRAQSSEWVGLEAADDVITEAMPPDPVSVEEIEEALGEGAPIVD